MVEKKIFILLIIGIISSTLISCSPVLSKRLMKEGSREVSFFALRENPDAYKGRLFILGGIIIDTKYTEKGSQIEALYVPVDSYGHLKNTDRSEGRYLAVLSRAAGMLDPVVYHPGREITLAGEFTGTLKGKIDEMEYVYPVFEIEQVYLWQEESAYYTAPPYDMWYYPYWGPWWWDYPPYFVPAPQGPPVPPPSRRPAPPPARVPPVRGGERGE